MIKVKVSNYNIEHEVKLWFLTASHLALFFFIFCVITRTYSFDFGYNTTPRTINRTRSTVTIQPTEGRKLYLALSDLPSEIVVYESSRMSQQ